MHRLLLFLIYLMVTVPVQAAAYYVDSVIGADTNTGLTPTEAWRKLHLPTGRCDPV